MAKCTLADGPFVFSVESIDRHVEPNRIGVYVLLERRETRNGALRYYARRVGRSDTNANRRLKTYLAGHQYTWDKRYKAITHFSFEYFDTKKAAFDVECALYHDWKPVLNEPHPGRPRGTDHCCPVVVNDACPPCADED